MRARDEWGQAVPLLLVAVLVAGTALLGLVRLARAVGERSRAQAAADAAALAAAVEGPTGAARIARANGATLLSVRALDGDELVIVRVGDHTATARSRLVPG
jgi:outer membrane lipoprotein SlyB